MRRLMVWALCLCSMGSAWAQGQGQGQGQAAQSAAVLQARAMLNNGDGQAAYRVLLPLVDARAGEPAFDSLFGQAALAAGKGTRAVMAFNRCIAVAPQKGVCRLGLARAHMALDETRSARRELAAIRSTSPPPAVTKIVQRYLGALAGTSIDRQQDFDAWMELLVGYDSNTNVAPSDSLIALPGFAFFSGGTFTSAQDSSPFYQAKLGFSWRLPVSTHWDLVTGSRAWKTMNTQVAATSHFDEETQVSGHIGASAHYGRQRFGLMLRGQYDALGGESYRNVFGVLGQYNYFLTQDTRVGGFLQYSRFNYQYSRNANLHNVDSVSGGLSILHTKLHDRLLLFAGVQAGTNDKVDDNGPDRASSDYYGLRLGATWLFRPQWQAGINIFAERRNYDGHGRFFYDRSREDDRVSAEFSLAWHLTKDLSLNAKYNYIHSDSNIPIRDYDREIVSFGVRYEFL